MRQRAASCRLAVDDHGAGAAFAETTAEFRTVEGEIVAQEIDQRRIAFAGDDMLLSIHPQRISSRPSHPIQPAQLM